MTYGPYVMKDQSHHHLSSCIKILSFEILKNSNCISLIRLATQSKCISNQVNVLVPLSNSLSIFNKLTFWEWKGVAKVCINGIPAERNDFTPYPCVEIIRLIFNGYSISIKLMNNLIFQAGRRIS